MYGESHIDQAFIQKLTEIIHANLENENFGVDELAHASGMTRSIILQRLLDISGKSTTRFIREVRLQKGLEMLQHQSRTASEVAYKVGFGSPAYFNTCFHDYFGYTPGEVKKKNLTDGGPISDNDPSEDQISPVPTVSGLTKNTTVINRRMIIPVIVLALLLVIAILCFPDLFSLKESGKIVIPGLKNPDRSIAVLPFKNLSKSNENQYFADGIMEDILNQLFRIRNLRVISRTSTEQFRDGNFSTGEIAKKLHAAYLLEGSVRRQDTKVRISVQLIDAHNDSHLWSAHFDRELTNIFEVQNEIAIRVATELHAAISHLEIAQIGKTPTNNSEAYDNFLRGRFLLNKANSEQRVDINKEGLMASVKYFEKAIEADPDFALAYANLANAWFNLSAWGWLKPYNTGIQKAKELSAKALEIDPECAVAHAVKGLYLIWPERKFEEGRKEFQLSIRLNPNYPYVHQAYAQLLMITGPIEEAREQMDRVIELEPYFWVVQNLNAWIYYFEGRHKEALEACRIARDLKPDYIFNNWLFFLNYAKLGEAEHAAAELQTIVHNYPVAGQFTDEIIALNPDFDLLRNDARFLSIIDETGLTPYHKRVPK